MTRSAPTPENQNKRNRWLPATVALLFLAVAATSPLANADHGGSNPTEYHPVWFEWRNIKVGGVPTIDILVIPPTHGQLYNGNGALGAGGPVNVLGRSPNPEELTPCDNSYMDATMDTIQGWRDAIAEFGESWLQDLVIKTWVPGCGTSPPLSQNMEIIVGSSENKGPILGVAVSSRPCLIDNSRMLVQSFTYRDYYNVAGHEIGHCLGLDHTVNTGLEHEILEAVYHHTPGSKFNPFHCQSNLNVDGLRGVFAYEFGVYSEAGRTGSVTHNNYEQISTCGANAQP